MSADHIRFLGLTKTQFVGLLVVLLLSVVAAQVYLVASNITLAEQGAQTHTAVCAWKGTLDRQISDSEKFLNMTVSQRERKYGKAVGDIPESVIRRSLSNERLTETSLKLLQCTQ